MKVGYRFAFSIIAFVVCMYAIHPSDGSFSYIYFVHLAIIGISCFSIFSYHNQPYSLFKVYHIFNLFFFGIAPMLQFYQNIAFVGENFLTYNERLLSSCVILLCTVFYNIIYSYFFSKPVSLFFLKNFVHPFDGYRFTFSQRSNSLKLFLLLLSLLCFLCVLYINNFNFVGLFFRSGEVLERVSLSKTSFLLVEKFVRPLSLMVFVSSMFYLPNSKLLNFTLFVLLLLTASPVGMGRNAAAGFYIPLLLLFIPFFKKPHVFVSSFIYGLLVVFPSLDYFRRLTDTSTGVKLAIDFDMFTELHFDAYASLTRIISNDIITYGNQLLGVLLFFIPSSFWPTKPLSSGIFQAEILRLTFDNISCPYIAEGYINFGYLGIALFLILVAILNGIVDKVYWSFSVFYKVNFFNLLYLESIGMFLFVLRGDLMSGFAYTTGMIVTGIVCFRVLVGFNKIK